MANVTTNYYNIDGSGTTATSITASLYGTASRAVTSSFTTSGSYALSASYAVNGGSGGGGLETGSTYPFTASVAVNATKVYTEQAVVDGDFYPALVATNGPSNEAVWNAANVKINPAQGKITAENVTASFYGTASQAISASWAPAGPGGGGLETGSTYPITASQAVSASWAPNAASLSGQTGYFPLWTNNQLSPTSSIAQSGSSIGIGTANPIQPFHLSFAASSFSATGGTITTTGLYTVHTFTATDTFTVLTGSANLEYLIIAGGGGGGSPNAGNAGGGGAGGYRSSVPGELSGRNSVAETPLAVTVGTYEVKVGAGGAASTNGQTSSLGIISSSGGGAGGIYSNPGLAGGSGGGGGQSSPAAQTGGLGIAGQGCDGGDTPGGAYAGSGGGGAGAKGSGSWGGGNNPEGGYGGNGITSSIDGAPTVRGGGGGGSSHSTATQGASVGGVGGGGAGHYGVNAGTNGSPNTGGGGGGGGETVAAGTGGSGIVIVRYLTPTLTDVVVTAEGKLGISTLYPNNTVDVAGGITCYNITASRGILTASQAISASWVADSTHHYIPSWTNRVLSKTSSLFDGGIGSGVGVGTFTVLGTAKLNVYIASSSAAGTVFGALVNVAASNVPDTSTAPYAGIRVINTGAGSNTGVHNNAKIGLTGGWLTAIHAASGTSTSSLVQGLFVESFNSSSTGGMVTELRGVTIKLGSTATGINTAMAFVENAYALVIESATYTQGTTPSWGIYQKGASDNNYFAGSVGVGGADPTAAPVFKLKVTGHVGPTADSTYDLGSTAVYWRNAYIDRVTASLGFYGTASVAISASYAPGGAPGGGGLGTGSTYPFTSSYAQTASYFYQASSSGAWKIYVDQQYGNLVFDFS